jgi:hypothetical protein
MPGNVGRKRPPRERYRMRVTLEKKTVEYLTGWRDRLGRNIGHSEVIDELVSYAIMGDIEKVIEDERGAAETSKKGIE